MLVRPFNLEVDTESKPVKDLTQKRLKELLSYDVATGVFTWLVTRGKAKAGNKAGGPDKDGYRKVRIDGGTYLAHRLAYLYVTGSWPDTEVDHADLDKDNNAWDNLRPSTRLQNMANRQVRGDSHLGVKGVGLTTGGSYTARIKVGGAAKYLGSFASIDAAKNAYDNAANDANGEFARVA